MTLLVWGLATYYRGKKEQGFLWPTNPMQNLTIAWNTIVLTWAAIFALFQHGLYGQITSFMVIMLVTSFVFIIPWPKSLFPPIVSTTILYIGLYLLEPSNRILTEHYLLVSIFVFFSCCISYTNYVKLVNRINSQFDIEEKTLLLVETNDRLTREISARKQYQEKLEQANEQLAAISSLDALTGIPNRRKLEEALTDMWNYAQITRSSVTIMIIDIDSFKLYNDTYGHIAGDYCLQQVAIALQSCIRKNTDLIARFGGEEFVFAAVGLNEQDALNVGEKIRQTIEALKIELDSPPICSRVTASIGISWLNPTEDDNVQEALIRADLAMYDAKHTGRNQVKFA
ncbi:MAG: GGDEF domain-containing protein [Syntrophomonadaceae bacterium]|jgi:diguanylate cyclase (GGDEF)-like protein|nr:GGDEF domain-containing protein [Syntrophomonadaceae bacterium]